MSQKIEKSVVSQEEITYARILKKNVTFSLSALAGALFLYIGNLLWTQSIVTSDFWKLSLEEYHHATNLHITSGWGWVRQLAFIDFVNLLSVAFLAGITIICYLSILPLFVKQKDKVFVSLIILEIVILLFAASGFLQAGGH